MHGRTSRKQYASDFLKLGAFKISIFIFSYTLLPIGNHSQSKLLLISFWSSETWSKGKLTKRIHLPTVCGRKHESCRCSVEY